MLKRFLLKTKTMNEERKYIVLHIKKVDSVKNMQIQHNEPQHRFLHCSADYESCKEFAKLYFDKICGRIFIAMDTFIGPFRIFSFEDYSDVIDNGYDDVVYSVRYQEESIIGTVICEESIHILKQDYFLHNRIDIMKTSYESKNYASQIKDRASIVTIAKRFQNEKQEE